MSMLDLQQYTQDLAALRKTLIEAGEALHIESLKEQLEELTEEMNQPEFWNDADRANKINQKTGNIRNKIEHYEGLLSQADDIEVAMEMAEELGVDMREFERVMLLRSVDVRWMDHIDAMDQLRDGIGFRAYSGKNPVTEYQIEAGYMFDELNHLIRKDTVRRIYQVKIQKTPERIQTVKATQAGKVAQAARAGGGVAQPRRLSAAQKVGRNDPCPCGSAKKYKARCGKNQPTAQRAP